MNFRMIVVGAACFVGVLCQAQDLTFKNKTDFPVKVAVGSRANPPYKAAAFVMTSSPKIKPGKDAVINELVASEKVPQIMVWEDGKPEAAYVYEIRANPGKRLMVQLTSDKGEFKLSSVPFSYNTISKDNIVFVEKIDLAAMANR